MTEPTETLRRIEATLTDTRERLIRMESAGLAAQVERIAGKVDILERDVRQLQDAESRRQGAKGAFEWLAKYGPSLSVLAVILSVVLMLTKGVLVK